MSTNDGGPAFPSNFTLSKDGSTWTKHENRGGMTLRDFFAAKALQGLLADTNTHVGYVNPKTGRGWPNDEKKFRNAVAFVAYSMADSMLRAREVKP